jgi:transcriptional regulator with XRE-family HTH domain
MSSHLQEQIRTRMEAQDLTIYALEKKAGIKRSAARNILQGLSKKPGGEVLLAIAKALDCRIEDLLGEDHEKATITKTSTPKANYQWNEKLCLDSVKAVAKQLGDRELNFEQVLAIIKEVYRYSIKKNSDKADIDFVNWLVNKDT